MGIKALVLQRNESVYEVFRDVFIVCPNAVDLPVQSGIFIGLVVFVIGIDEGSLVLVVFLVLKVDYRIAADHKKCVGQHIAAHNTGR